MSGIANDKNKKLVTVLGWILGLLFILVGLQTLFNSSALGGVLVVLSGLLILPVLSNSLKRTITFWSKRWVRIALPLIIFVTGAGIDKDKNDKTKFSKPIVIENWYQKYLDKNQKIIERLDSEQKNKRKIKIEKLKTNPVYIDLVDKTILSTEYLEVLSAISHGISRIDPEIFTIGEDIMTSLLNSNNGEEKKNFVINIVALDMNKNGGIPVEIIKVFDRYQKAYRFYGQKGSIVSNGTSTIEIPINFDLTGIFGAVCPDSEVILDAIFEARDKGYSNWTNTENAKYPYFSSKKAYMDYIGGFYTSSQYYLQVDKEVSVNQLYSAYENNAVKADNLYKGKRIVVSGEISDLGTDMLDMPYVTFKIGDFQAVTCYFSPDKANLIGELNKQDQITIIGICQGNVLNNIVIEECQIWE